MMGFTLESAASDLLVHEWRQLALTPSRFLYQCS